MASVECSIGTLPNSYEEIHCSSSATNRAFMCKPGYKSQQDTIIINNNPSATPCDYTSPSLNCEKLPYKLPGIVRPDKSENFQCGPTNITSSSIDTIENCLKQNITVSPGELRDRCNSLTGCTFQRYKGDYLKTIETGTATTPTTEKELISFEEAHKLYSQALPTRVCWPKTSAPNLETASISTGTAKDSGPTSTEVCISLEHYDLNNTTLPPTTKTAIEDGNNIGTNTPYNMYMGYNISTVNNDNYIGTTVYDTLHKISPTRYPDYYPGSTPNEAASDFRYSCNSNSYFHGTNTNVTVPTQSNTQNPLNLDMYGCEMNTCYSDTDSTFRTIYNYMSVIPQPSTGYQCSSSGDSSFFTCRADDERFGIYHDSSCQNVSGPTNANMISNVPTLHVDAYQCNYCGVIDSESECNNNNKCYWYQSAGESISECRNKCSARKTLGECEQFYENNKNLLSDTLYNFDGRDHQCVWIPSYFNNDKSMGSTDGKCRDVDTPCFPATSSPTCEITIPSKNIPLEGTVINNHCYLNESEMDNYLTGTSSKNFAIEPYCGENYINKNEDICVKTPLNACISKPECKIVNKPFKCVSDGEPYIDSGNNKVYTTDKECLEINDYTTCENKEGCISVPSRSICEAKSIKELIEDQASGNPKYSILKDICEPLKAQVPVNYDPNLVEEEGLNLASYSEDHNVDPPFITSRYLCDVCTIRDNDIQKIMADPSNPLYNINVDMNSDVFDQQQYCEKPIDKYDSINQRSPCKWHGGSCMSRCKIPFINNPPSLTKQGLEQAKETCSNTLQFSDTPQYNVVFPNRPNGQDEDTSDYYKDMYCAWDGFECHNSIPCKEAQRTRCEDLGYHWYVGTSEDVNYQKEDNGVSHEVLSTEYPIKRKGDGKPIIGDSQGICVFPNTEHVFVGAGADYTMRAEFNGHHGIILKWREFGTDWRKDNSLNRRMSGVGNDNSSPVLNSSASIIHNHTTSNQGTYQNHVNNLPDIDLGENMIFIPIVIQGGMSSHQVEGMINNALRSYEYFAMNGDYVVYAKTIYEWAIDNYTELWYGPSTTDEDLTGGSESVNGDEKRIYNYGGYFYYKYGNVIGRIDDTTTTTTTTTTVQYPELQSQNKVWTSGLNSKLPHDVIMSNVIYDLRGTINLLPVIDGECVLEVKQFRINPDTGHINFRMYPEQGLINSSTFAFKTYQRFQFDSFMGNEIFSDSSTSNNLRLKPEIPPTITCYRRDTLHDIEIVNDLFNYPGRLAAMIQNLPDDLSRQLVQNGLNQLAQDGWSPQVVDPLINQLPILKPYNNDIPTVRAGYGSLYEPFITNKDKLYYIDNFKASDYNGNIRDSINNNYLDFNVEYDMYKENQKDFYLDGVYYIRSVDSGHSAEQYKYCKCSGSLESFKYMLIHKPRPEGQGDFTNTSRIIQLKDHPMIKLLSYYNKELQTQSSEITKSIIPDDIRKALLWSMTRPVHPAFGNLIYDPEYAYGPGQLLDHNSNTSITHHKLPYIGAAGNIYRGTSNDIYDGYKKHILDPFSGTTLNTRTTLPGMIYWDNLLTYIGGNYNKIIQYNTLPNPSPVNGWWDTGDSNWHNRLNTILRNNTNTNYYTHKYVSYINLTPHNEVCEIQTNNHIDAIIRRRPDPPDGCQFPTATPTINTDALTHVSNSNKDNYEQYFYPGKWLAPPSATRWPTQRPTEAPGNYGLWSEPTIVDPVTGRLISETNPELQKLKQLFGDSSTSSELYPMPSILGDIEKISDSSGPYGPKVYDINYPGGTGTLGTRIDRWGEHHATIDRPNYKPIGEILTYDQSLAWPKTPQEIDNCTVLNQYMDRQVDFDYHYSFSQGQMWAWKSDWNDHVLGVPRHPIRQHIHEVMVGYGCTALETDSRFSGKTCPEKTQMLGNIGDESIITAVLNSAIATMAGPVTALLKIGTDVLKEQLKDAVHLVNRTPISGDSSVNIGTSIKSNNSLPGSPRTAANVTTYPDGINTAIQTSSNIKSLDHVYNTRSVLRPAILFPAADIPNTGGLQSPNILSASLNFIKNNNNAITSENITNYWENGVSALDADRVNASYALGHRRSGGSPGCGIPIKDFNTDDYNRVYGLTSAPTALYIPSSSLGGPGNPPFQYQSTDYSALVEKPIGFPLFGSSRDGDPVYLHNYTENMPAWNSQNYPFWLIYQSGNDLRQCMNYLAYVPNAPPTNTLTKVSLDNCSLPILQKPADTQNWNSNFVTNTATNFERTTDPRTIRDICPDLCQKRYHPPQTTLNNVNIYTVPTGSQLSLWIIPSTTPSTPNSMFHNYITFSNYYGGILVPVSSGSKTLKNLFTLSGKDTVHVFYISTTNPTGGILCPANNRPTACISPSPMGERLFSADELVEDIADFNCRREMLNVIQTQCLSRPSGNSFVECIRSNQHLNSICGNTMNNLNPIATTFDNTKDRLEPWLHVSEEQEPANFSSSIRNIALASENNPYKYDDNCGTSANIKFTRINQTNNANNIEFFKPRYGSSGISRIFKHLNNDDTKDYGCIRNDIMNVEEDFFDLSCNTNTIYSIERNKFVLINAIIEESIQSTNNQPKLNISDRTKLVLMDEEELLEKAAELGLDMNKLNEYTKPKLINKVKDIYNPLATPSGRFEMWDELENDYLNISSSSLPSGIPKLGVKEWDFIGCGLDHNNLDSTRTFQTCKDKYPGLCQKNESLCSSSNPRIKEAIMLDCPETCKVQFNSLNTFSQTQVGDLSICSRRGRCKWSRDQDESNLLPLCDDTYARTYSDNDTCSNYQNLSVGACPSEDNTPNCLREKCNSMQGCNFTEAVTSTCILSQTRRDDINAASCVQHNGRWTGQTSDIGSCIIPEYNDSTLTREQCNALAGTYIEDSPASCVYNSQNWLPLEDPCSMPHDVNLNAMSQQEMLNYPNILQSSISFDRIEPVCIGSQEEIQECQNGRRHPGGFKIHISGSSPEIIEGDYIHITSPNLGEQCSQYLTGYSRVLRKESDGSIVIRGPSQSYTLEHDLFNPEQYDIGECIIDKQIRITSANPSQNAINCMSLSNTRGGSCTYIDSEDPGILSDVCKSCSLITSRNECVDKNKTSTCGWGEIQDICESIGEIGECNDMYVDGCYWDVDRQMCRLNDKRKTEGCMKCGDIKHRHTCNSLSNCFFDRSVQDASGNGICKSCSEAHPGEGASPTHDQADACNTQTEGKCQWRKENDLFRCRHIDPYPLIYEWIWYNKVLVLALIIALYIWWKLPFSADSMPLNIFLKVIKILILFVVIPALFVFPGVVKADGNDGRKYYAPGYLDDQSDMSGAKWPAVIYDNNWDEKVMDNDTLRSIIDLELSPDALNWNKYVPWLLIKTWNYIANSNQDSEHTFLFAICTLILMIIYGLSVSNIKYIPKNPTPKTTVTVIVVLIGLFYYINFARKTYHKAIVEYDNIKYNENIPSYASPEELNKQTNLVKYYGRQVKDPPGDGFWSLIYSTDKKDKDGNDIHVCPEGCRLYVSNQLSTGIPTNSTVNFGGEDYEVFPTPVEFPACGDTRSFFSFTGSLNPDEKVKIDHYDHNDPASISNWKVYQGDTGVNYICPDTQKYYKFPYDIFCNDKRDTCKSTQYYNVAPASNYVGESPIPSENLLVSDRGDTFKSMLDEKCLEHQNEYGVCDTYHVSNLKIDPYNDESDGITKQIQINCHIAEDTETSDYCPFPENPTYYLGDIERQPIKIWQDMYDTAFSTPPHRRLTRSTKLDWQNQERYAIVDQNYMLDRG